MRTLGALIWVELKLFWREPAATFFTFVFPLLVLVIFGSIFGNAPSPRFGGRGSVDVSAPGYVAMIVGTVGLLGLAITVATYRDGGVLRRLRATPLRTGTLLAAEIIVYLAMTAVGIALLVVVGRIVYDLRLPASAPATALAVVLAAVAIFAVGFAVAGLAPTARAAQAIGSLIFFPMLFLSGAAIPRQIMPADVRRLAELLPLTQVVKLVEQLWFEGAWEVPALIFLLVLLALATVVALRTFRWE